MQTDVNSPQGVRFSLRFLLLLTLIFSCWLAFLRFYPHLAVFGMSIFSAWYSARFLFKPSGQIRRSIGRMARVCFFMLSWILFYVLSIGPAAVFVEELRTSHQEILRFFYGPVIWLHDETPLQEPLEDYVKLWRSTF